MEGFSHYFLPKEFLKRIMIARQDRRVLRQSFEVCWKLVHMRRRYVHELFRTASGDGMREISGTENIDSTGLVEICLHSRLSDDARQVNHRYTIEVKHQSVRNFVKPQRQFTYPTSELTTNRAGDTSCYDVHFNDTAIKVFFADRRSFADPLGMPEALAKRRC